MQPRDSDFHPHLKERMEQRGITLSEINYETNWEGKFYEEKEITVYYKHRDERMVLLTTLARINGKSLVE